MDLSADLYFLILQKLKEKAIELETLIINKKSRNNNEGVACNDGLSCLEKDLIKGGLSISGVILFRAFIVSTFFPIHIYIENIDR